MPYIDEGTCSLDLLENASGYFDLNLAAARSIIKGVALATSKWRTAAKKVGARSAEIDRMSSAFEHDCRLGKGAIYATNRALVPGFPRRFWATIRPEPVRPMS
jgi:hypothetical protein